MNVLRLARKWTLLSLPWTFMLVASSARSNLLPHSQGLESAINASISIRDHVGTNVLSSFKIMVNYQAQSHIANNATASNIHDRREPWGRLANHCPPPLKFLESFCDPDDGKEGSLQRYKVRCETQFRRETPITAARQGRVNSVYVRTGHCDDQEICLDVRTRNPRLKIASCNRVEIFEEWDLTKDGKFQPIVNGAVFEPFVSMYGIVSQIDQRTPIEVDKLEIDTWSSNEDTGQGDVQTKSCQDCINVQTDVLAPQTDSLKVEARLLSGVSAAATIGILWLTIVTAG